MTSTATDRTLATFAMIEAHAAHGSTHLDNFVPLSIEVMRANPSESYTATVVASEVYSRFNLKILTQAMETVLKRAVRTGLLARKDKQFRLTELALRTPLLASEETRFLRQQTDLANKFVTYCSERHSVDLDQNDAENALFDQIERSTVSLIRTDITGAIAKNNSGEQSDELAFLAADFIAYVTDCDSTAYEWLIKAAKGAMLAAYLYLPNAGEVDRKFRSTTLYFDSPLILQAAGLEGEEATRSVREVIRLAQLHGANLGIFTHSLSEAQGVIQGAVSYRKGRADFVPQRPDGVLANAIRFDLTADDLLISCAKLEETLRQLGFSITDRPQPTYNEDVDEVSLRERLHQRVHYKNEAALNKDAQSLRSVHILRRGETASHIENCKSVFITDNSGVVDVAEKFFDRMTHEWPVASLLSDLGTLLYLKDPGQAAEIPRLQMAAGAYSALQPPIAVWNKWLESIERRESRGEITGSDIALLCHSQESRRILMEVTHGNAANVKMDTVNEVLNETKRRISEPYAKKASEEESETLKATARASVAEQQKESAVAEAQRLQNELDGLRRTLDIEEQRRKSNLATDARKFAKNVIHWGLGISATLLITLSLVSDFLTETDKPWFTIIAGAIILSIGIIRSLIGGNAKEWLQPVESKIIERRKRALMRRYTLDIPPNGD